MRKNFWIRNGYRDRVVRLWSLPKVKIGASIFIVLIAMALIAVFKPELAPAGIALGWAPFLKFDKSGLTGENEKFITDLEKRMKLEPDSAAKTEVMNLIKAAQDGVTTLQTRFKDIDDDKIKLLMELLGTDDKAIRSILSKQGEALTKLQANLDKVPEDLSIRAQVSKWQTENKDALAKLKNRQQASLTPLEVRLNSPSTPANTLNGSSYIPRPEFESGATEIVRNQLTFWNYITKGRAGSAVFVWVNKKNPEGDAGWIGPGVAKPGISLELASETSNAKKVAASEKVAMELLEDVEGFSSYIEQELRFQVDKETNDVLMSNAGSATIPKGIQNHSVAYTLAGVETTNPNFWDCLIAIEAQLEAGNLAGAITHFVNPVDYANMMLTKAQSQGQLFVPRLPAGAIVKDNNIPVGYVQSAILQYYVVKIYKDYTVTYGWENDDFTKNLVTLVGERRIHQYVKENHTGFAIYDTFANIMAAIDGEAV